MPRRLSRMLILCLVALALSACGKSAQVHYRVTVDVETPDGPKTGSSVWRWRTSEALVPIASKYDSRLHGEAVAVDLPGGRTLFALLRDVSGLDRMGYLPQRQFRDIASARQRADQVGYIRMIAARTGQVRKLACKTRPTEITPQISADPAYDCPMLVTFTDMADPTSVTLVDPDDLAATFGEGHALKRITVQITDEPLTTGIEKRLPQPIYRGFFNWDGDLGTWNADQAIGLSDFSRGER